MRNITYCSSYTGQYPLSIQKTLDGSILSQEFVVHNKYHLQQYVIDRIHVFDVLVSHKLHLDEVYGMGKLTRELIWCCLQQIETILPLIEDEVDQYVIKKIGDARALFAKRIEW